VALEIEKITVKQSFFIVVGLTYMHEFQHNLGH